jgi:hypothetical protein
MACLEHEKRLRYVEQCRVEVHYFLFRKELHLLPSESARQAANTAALALARACNELHRHESRCDTCRLEDHGRLD